eukprot:6173697-Pleurochrysis_carterae.AAC.3
MARGGDVLEGKNGRNEGEQEEGEGGGNEQGGSAKRKGVQGWCGRQRMAEARRVGVWKSKAGMRDCREREGEGEGLQVGWRAGRRRGRMGEER